MGRRFDSCRAHHVLTHHRKLRPDQFSWANVIKHLMIAIRCSAMLFDMDGVLIDSTPAVARVWHQWAIEHGFDPETVVHMAHGRPSRTTIRELLPNADIELEDR